MMKVIMVPLVLSLAVSNVWSVEETKETTTTTTAKTESESKATTPAEVEAEKETEATVKAPAETTGTGAQKFKDIIGSVKASLEKKDIATAKTEFNSFVDEWEKGEATVKKNDKKAYKAIEKNIDQLKFSLVKKDAKNIKKTTKLVASLEQLIQTHENSF